MTTLLPKSAPSLPAVNVSRTRGRLRLTSAPGGVGATKRVASEASAGSGSLLAAFASEANIPVEIGFLSITVEALDEGELSWG